MIVRGVAHKGLRRFMATGSAAGLPAAFAEKIRNILTFLQEMEQADDVLRIPVWRAHRLAGARRGTWSLVVSRNWRITFRVAAGEIVDLDFEDYH